MLRRANLFQRAQMTVAGVASASARKRGGGTTRGGDVPPSLRAICRLLIAKSQKQRGCHSTTLLQTELLWVLLARRCKPRARRSERRAPWQPLILIAKCRVSAWQTHAQIQYISLARIL